MFDYSTNELLTYVAIFNLVILTAVIVVSTMGYLYINRRITKLDQRISHAQKDVVDTSAHLSKTVTSAVSTLNDNRKKLRALRQ